MANPPPPKIINFSSNFPVHKTEPPYHPQADSAKARGALGVIIARVTLAAFGGDQKSQQGRRDRGHCLWRAGVSNPLIFSTSRWTCICGVLFFDSLSEYPFAIIAAGIFILMSGLIWLSHIKKNLAAFASPQST
jgi:hypothetical protein